MSGTNFKSHTVLYIYIYIAILDAQVPAKHIDAIAHNSSFIYCINFSWIMICSVC